MIGGITIIKVSKCLGTIAMILLFLTACNVSANQKSKDTLLLIGVQEPFNLEAVKEAADAGADMNYIKTTLGEENPIAYGLRVGMHLDMYKCLLENGCNPNGHDMLGRPLAFSALEQGRPDIMLLLLDNGADIKAHYLGNDLLDIAVRKQYVSAVKDLLKRGMLASERSLTLATDYIVENPISNSYPQIEITNLLIQNLLEHNTSSGLNPLVDAAILGDDDRLIQMMKTESYVETDDAVLVTSFAAAFCNENTFGALEHAGLIVEDAVDVWHIAVEYGNLDVLHHELVRNSSRNMWWISAAIVNNQTEVVRFLLEQGAINELLSYIEGKDMWEYFDNDLSTAACNGNLQIIKDLIEYGYPVNDLVSFVAARSALNNDNSDIVEYFIQQGLDINYVDGDNGTLLQSVCSKGTIEDVRYALQKGATITADCLSVSAMRGQTDIVELLLESGADPNDIGQYSDPPLISAIDDGLFDIVKVLVSHGADVNAVRYTNEEHTKQVPAICVAAQAPSYRILDYLIEQGADINVTSSDGRTPLDYARTSSTMNPTNEKILMVAASTAKK